MTSDFAVTSQRAHRANIERYEKLLRTQLTDHERSYVERRLAEEWEALRRSAKPMMPSAASAA